MFSAWEFWTAGGGTWYSYNNNEWIPFYKDDIPTENWLLENGEIRYGTAFKYVCRHSGEKAFGRSAFLSAAKLKKAVKKLGKLGRIEFTEETTGTYYHCMENAKFKQVHYCTNVEKEVNPQNQNFCKKPQPITAFNSKITKFYKSYNAWEAKEGVRWAQCMERISPGLENRNVEFTKNFWTYNYQMLTYKKGKDLKWFGDDAFVGTRMILSKKDAKKYGASCNDLYLDAKGKNQLKTAKAKTLIKKEGAKLFKILKTLPNWCE